MSAPVQTPTSQSVALAKREAAANGEVLAIGELPAAVRAAVEQRKMLARAAAELATTSWGAKLDMGVRVAVARWGEVQGVDIATEIDVLGGRIYKNTRYYYRKLGELEARGVVAYARADHVHADPRLAKLAGAKGPNAEKAAEEMARREWERVLHGLPDEATGACVFRIGLRQPDGSVREVTGAKACGVPGKSDPVGTAHPMETSESRAMRRAMLKLAGEEPAVRGLVEVDSDEGMALESAVQDGYQMMRATEKADPSRQLRGGVPAVDVDPMHDDDAEQRRYADEGGAAA
jgi:hypothetical protein